MARGGNRPGAGRKAGSPNKATAERQAEVEASGLTPLEYMLPIRSSDELHDRCPRQAGIATRSKSMHLSDCVMHDGKECDCGELDLTVDVLHGLIPTHIASTGRFGFFVNHMGRECFIEAHDLPAGALATVAAASNLPDALKQTHTTAKIPFRYLGI